MKSAWRSLCLMGHKQETTMSSITVQSATPAALGGAVRWMMRWARALALYLDRRAAIKELGELDDRALRDIGLSRCELEKAVAGFAKPDITRVW
jgi:uncharacterized protein YjiS (DUF1127 family)